MTSSRNFLFAHEFSDHALDVSDWDGVVVRETHQPYRVFLECIHVFFVAIWFHVRRELARKSGFRHTIARRLQQSQRL
jgi:hypothetical protein